MSAELTERNTHDIKSRPKSIREILGLLANGKLSLKPFFQRKLVWRKEHKVEFIKTILFNYPFPEVYFSDASNDSSQLDKNKWVIDGQQRISAIQEYFLDEGDFEKADIVKFKDLSPTEQEAFLDYEVSVRELGSMTDEMLRLIFTRINLTEYSLNPMEKLNAIYSTTPLFLFARQCIDPDFEFDDYFKDAFIEDKLSQDQKDVFLNFFEVHSIFTANDRRRMADLQYMILLVITLDRGYFHRTIEIWKAFESNDYKTTKLQSNILPKMTEIILFINSLSLYSKSLWATKVNMFSLIIELSKLDDLNKLNVEKLLASLEDLNQKYAMFKKDKETDQISTSERTYFTNALQGVNDKANRIDRGLFLQGILYDCL